MAHPTPLEIPPWAQSQIWSHTTVNSTSRAHHSFPFHKTPPSSHPSPLLTPTPNMFNYSSYGNGGSVVDDPNLLSVVCSSAGQPINTNHPFFPDLEFAFPSSSSDYLMQQSRSTHSFGIPDPVPVNPFYYSSPHVSSSSDFHHADILHGVYSTGDLQGMNSSMQVFAENCTTQEGTDVAVTAGRIGRYTAEERKERIDRYRNKRNQRNFHKKITYACRKTLADSRPRVRGRFARNGEAENDEPESSETSFECYSYGTYDNGKGRNSSGNSGNSANGEGEWYWKQMQAALTTTDEEDENIWASLDSVFSVNLLS